MPLEHDSINSLEEMIKANVIELDEALNLMLYRISHLETRSEGERDKHIDLLYAFVDRAYAILTLKELTLGSVKPTAIHDGGSNV